MVDKYITILQLLWAASENAYDVNNFAIRNRGVRFRNDIWYNSLKHTI